MSEQLIAIATDDGQTVNVNAELLREYYKEAVNHLRLEQDEKTLFKLAVEAQAEALGVKKSVLSKYYKTRFKESVKKLAAEAETFQKLDEAFE